MKSVAKNTELKNHCLIFIFCFSFLLSKAQDKIFPFSNYAPKSSIDLRFNYSPLVNIYSKSVNNISIKTQLPKLPFFCNIEEKCRSKFNIFLKIRAGNDESYERMIRNK